MKRPKYLFMRTIKVIEEEKKPDNVIYVYRSKDEDTKSEDDIDIDMFSEWEFNSGYNNNNNTPDPVINEEEAIKDEATVEDSIDNFFSDDMYNESKSDNTTEDKTEDTEDSVEDFFSSDIYNGSEPENIEEKNDINEFFSDDMYNHKQKNTVTVKNTDGIESYRVAQEFKVTRKEALTSIEAKTPFIVGKLSDNKNKITEGDIVYKTIAKMKGHKIRRVGYLEVTSKVKKSSLKLTSIKDLVCLLDNYYPVRRKRKFNHKKVGYIKLGSLSESFDNKQVDDVDKYIEVTQSEGIKPIIRFFIIILLLVGLKSLCDIGRENGWNIDNLTLYKTEEIVQYKTNIVEISHSENPILHDGKLSINIESSAKNEDDGELYYKIKIQDTNSKDMLYESDYMVAGSKLNEIILDAEIVKKYTVDNKYRCVIIADTFKGDNKSFIGTMKSNFEMRVK